MKKYPFLAMVFLSLLLVGSTHAVDYEVPGQSEPACLNPSFWGYMHGVPIHSVPGGQVIVPPLAGVTVELWFGGRLISMYRTSSQGKYCLYLDSENAGNYIIRLPGCFDRQVYWPGSGSVRIDFNGVACVSPPLPPVPGPPPSPAPPE
jgi:hypothetical protein